MSVKEARPTSRATSTATNQTNIPKELPTDGMSRYTGIKPFIPVSREKWRTLVREGKAPQPIRLSSRCVFYENKKIHAWLQDPLNYREEVLA